MVLSIPTLSFWLWDSKRLLSDNLALSRALGDFRYKKNSSLSPQAQIVTADPDVTCHEIMEDDEFIVLASDGDHGFHFIAPIHIF